MLDNHRGPAEAICVDNDKTKERLLSKTEVVPVPYWEDDTKDVALIISRYPLAY
jgi:hypothetical protein